jgi:hypothetical protein
LARRDAAEDKSLILEDRLEILEPFEGLEGGEYDPAEIRRNSPYDSSFSTNTIMTKTMLHGITELIASCPERRQNILHPLSNEHSENITQAQSSILGF